MSRRVLPAVFAVAAFLVLGAGPAQALTTTPCKHSSNFRCGTVAVPLDRSGGVPGTVKLAVAVENARKGADGYLLALSGGPGQPSVGFADSFRVSLAPALRHRRLVLLDQRGTGKSGALTCPALQRLGTLDPVDTHLVQACAERLGPARRFYSTTDSVQDIEAVRQAVGAPALEVMGVSYGTYVAVQYARRFPATTAGLILDSAVGPDGIDPYFLDTFERLGRILRDQCAGSRCATATTDPVGDLGRLTRTLAARPVRGTIPAAHGRGVTTSIRDESELLLMIMSGDLNPFLQAALPGAIDAAAHGDAAPLLRLRRLAQGPDTPVSDFSAGLNVATTCADVALPYTWATPFPDRWSAWLHGSDAVPDSAFAPFTRHAVIDTSVAHDCLRWPQGDLPAAPSTAPLPDVPTLLLSGRLDTRTPTENARELLPALPRAQLLTVAGTGHDVLDSDTTGCAAKALGRWADGQAIGDPCQGRDNAVTVLSRPAGSLSDYRRAPGVAGERGRELFAVLDTLADAQVSALQTIFAGFTKVEGGGLRGGWFGAAADGVSLRLHRYQLVPGLRVTGSVRTSPAGGAVGAVVVDGPGRLDGRLTISAKGVVSGTLGGERVRYRPSRGSAASSGARGRVPARVAPPTRARLRRALAVRRAGLR
ncbi:MAG TPA: alpha/beta hydrolase [Baekduia sp.]|uniref:alpha/beta hydrolase n=1 Tax=Baekduia sp. TaxID=2600305 RepID=UPI002D783F11|nr:alpha/beta hydrolase [Baekduia sp.]HET6506207.1 alpha/beta hydrolase [Baekduia sp.]